MRKLLRPIHPSAALLLAAVAASPAAADEAPRRKPGLWEVQNEMSGHPSPMGPIQTCIDAATDSIVQHGMKDAAPKCEQQSWKREGDKLTLKSVCKLDKMTTTTEGTFTGSFDSNYRGEMHIAYDPPIHGMARTDMIVTAKWLGPCKPGQKPGDVTMPEMPNMPGMPKSINMEEMMKMRDQMKRMQQK